MSIFDRQAQLLSTIYPEQIWLDISDLEVSLTKAELNRYLINKISKYLSPKILRIFNFILGLILAISGLVLIIRVFA